MTTASKFDIFLVSQGKEIALGTFPIAGQAFQTVGPCGVRYDGTFALAKEGGAHVTMKAYVGKGLSVAPDLVTEEERVHELRFYLSPEQIDGRAFKEIQVPPFGIATLGIRLDGSAPPA